MPRVGSQSYGEIGDAIADAMADPTVRGVILDVDSAGGEVGGLFDLVEQIQRNQERKHKAALGGGKRVRAIGRLCHRQHRRPALRDAYR